MTHEILQIMKMQQSPSLSNVYEDFPGWQGTVKDARTMDELPPNARNYVNAISEMLGIRPVVISVGPGRSETIVLVNPFD